MNDEDQKDTPSEKSDGPPERPAPGRTLSGGVSPSRFLLAYFRQRADSVDVTQDNIEKILAEESRLWVLTKATDRGIDILNEVPIWSVTILGDSQHRNLVLLRVLEDWKPAHDIQIPGLHSSNDGSFTNILSAAVVRFHPKYIEEMEERAHPELITKLDETQAFAVLFNERYHSINRAGISGHLSKDVASVTEIGSWVNNATERIVIDNQKESIVYFGLKNEDEILDDMFRNVQGGLESRTPFPMANLDIVSKSMVRGIFDPGTVTISGYSKKRGYQITIIIATIAFCGLLAIENVPYSLSTPIKNAVGLIAFVFLAMTMIHGDLTDG